MDLSIEELEKLLATKKKKAGAEDCTKDANMSLNLLSFL